jgi:hypothetical protein
MDPTYTHLGSMKNFLGEKPEEEMINEYSNEKKVDSDTPRAFIALSDDDNFWHRVNAMDCKTMLSALS